MDVTRLRTGERIASIAGIALILIMFIFDWYGPKGATNLGGTNAWQSYSVIDIILFITALAGMGLAYLSGSRQRLNLPVAASAIVTALGLLSVILLIIRIIATPDYHFLGATVDTSVKAGVFLGLIAAAAIAYGGYLAMQEEGTTLGAEADRLRASRRGRGAPPSSGTGTGGPPPPSA